MTPGAFFGLVGALLVYATMTGNGAEAALTACIAVVLGATVDGSAGRR